MPRETSDGLVVYVESAAGSDPFGGGALVAVERVHGLGTRRVVASGSHGYFHSPSSFGGALLVSYRSRTEGTYGIRLLDPSRGRPGLVILDDPDWHELDALAVKPRSMPAGRSSVVNETVDFGFLYCLDAAETAGRHIDRGRIGRVRVLGAEPAHGSEGESGVVREHLLGEAQVEADGSFYVQAPARTPLRMELLDAGGGILAAMQDWIWVMPMERRGCIGCHEDRHLTPPNRYPLALRAQPRQVGNAQVVAPAPGVNRTRDPDGGHR
jgi:hypothetical protein